MKFVYSLTAKDKP